MNSPTLCNNPAASSTSRTRHSLRTRARPVGGTWPARGLWQSGCGRGPRGTTRPYAPLTRGGCRSGDRPRHPACVDAQSSSTPSRRAKAGHRDHLDPETLRPTAPTTRRRRDDDVDALFVQPSDALCARPASAASTTAANYAVELSAVELSGVHRCVRILTAGRRHHSCNRGDRFPSCPPRSRDREAACPAGPAAGTPSRRSGTP